MKYPNEPKEILELITLIAGVLTILASFSKTVRSYVYNLYKNYKTRRIARNDMPRVLNDIHSKVKNIDDRLINVEYEIKDPNSGGTIRGALKIIKAEIEATNWLSSRPTFRTTSSGINVFVNEAYCQLCSSTPDELMKLGWKNFVTDEEQADDYYNRWLLASKNLSQFASKLKIQNKQGEYRGEWTIRIRPLGPIENSQNPNDKEYVWSGTLYPSDDVAKAYARSFGIPLFN